MDEPQEPVAAPESASAEASTAAAPAPEPAAPPAEAPAAVPEPTAEVPAPSDAGINTEPVAPEAPIEVLPTGESALPAEVEPQEAPPPAAPKPAPQTAVSSPEPPPEASSALTPNWNTEYQPKGKQAQKARVEARLEKILARAHAKKTISNKDVVMLLRVSDATASRYLKMLVSRGQLQKTGKGRNVVYLVI